MTRSGAPRTLSATIATPYANLIVWLEDHEVPFEVHEHPLTFTAEAAAHADHVDARTFAKVVGVRDAEGNRILVVIDSTDRVDLVRLAAHLGEACRRVDSHVADRREVDDEAVVDRAEPRRAVAAASDGDLEARLAAHAERRDHISCIGTPDDELRMLVDAAVVDTSRLVVGGVPAVDDLASNDGGESAGEVAPEP